MLKLLGSRIGRAREILYNEILSGLKDYENKFLALAFFKAISIFTKSMQILISISKNPHLMDKGSNPNPLQIPIREYNSITHSNFRKIKWFLPISRKSISSKCVPPGIG